MRIPSAFLPCFLLVLGTHGSSQSSPLSGLEIFQDDYPKSFYYWTQTGAMYFPDEVYGPELSTMNGAMYNDSSPYDVDAKTDAYFAFGGNNPAEFLLRHLSARERPPSTVWKTFELFSPSHWAYLVGDALATNLGPSATLIELTQSPSVHFKPGDDIILYRRDMLVTPPVPDWSHYEFAHVNFMAQTTMGTEVMSVDRGQFETSALTFDAANTWVAPHAQTGPWGNPPIKYWELNYSTEAQPDANGKSTSDVIVAELANLFADPTPGPPYGQTTDPYRGIHTKFHAIEFDVLPFRAGKSVDGRSYDLDNDGAADGGIFNGVDTVAVGVTQFLQQLRNSPPFQNGKRLILADGQGVDRGRPNGILNGTELEGFARAWDEHPLRGWSTGVNQLAAWQVGAAAPALNYLNLKFADNLVDDDDVEVRLARYRACMAVATVFDFCVASYHNYLPIDIAAPGQSVGLWDEMIGAMDFATSNWLGAEDGVLQRLVDDPAHDILPFNSGSSMGTTFKKLWTSNDAQTTWTSGPGTMTVTPLTPGTDYSMTFTTPNHGWLDTNGPNDLVVFFDVKGSMDAALLPTETARKLSIELIGYDESAKHSYATVDAWVLGHDPAASSGDYLRVEAYWKNFDVSWTTFEIKLSVDAIEGLESFTIKTMRVCQGVPALAREYENGAILVNPGLDDYTFDLGTLFPNEYFYALSGNVEQRCQTPSADIRCPEVNDGTFLGSGTVTLGQRDAIFLRKFPQ